MDIKFRIAFARILLAGLALSITFCQSKTPDYHLAQLSDVQLHYEIKGEGEPLILIHGSLVDLRYWKEQESVLSQKFKLITYSRRYNYPNQNELSPDHSAIVEAKDLVALMQVLNIEQAHILGHSYGAYTALWFALEHPDKVKKLILAEPPLMRWLPVIPEGKGIMEGFMEKTWTPMGKEFTEKGDRAGLELTSQWYFQAPLDSVLPEWKIYFEDNAREWKALTISADAFPIVDVEMVRNFKKPVLIMSGELNVGNYNSLIDGELEMLLPQNERVLIKNAGHEMFLDNVSGSNKAILDFLKK